ncbi:MAG: hypothetical protein WBY75_00270, partial [Terracidiphilus sp.]
RDIPVAPFFFAPNICLRQMIREKIETGFATGRRMGVAGGFRIAEEDHLPGRPIHATGVGI